MEVFGAALVWLYLAWFAGGFAESKGYSFSMAFLLCLFLSPLIGLPIVAIYTNRPHR
jgi:hypothetical protein